MAGIAGAVTSAVSSTSVTLPSQSIQIIGADVYAATASGYLQLAVDSTRNALFPFTPVLGVTTTNVSNLGSGPWHFNLKPTGLTLNYTGVGLTSGTFVFYYGTPFADAKDFSTWKGIVVSFTTGTSLSYTFPSGDIKLIAMGMVFGGSNVQTATYIQDSFNPSTGKTLTVNWGVTNVIMGNGFQYTAGCAIIPLDNIVAAQTLTVTQVITTTHVGTGYLVFYYA